MDELRPLWRVGGTVLVAETTTRSPRGKNAMRCALGLCARPCKICPPEASSFMQVATAMDQNNEFRRQRKQPSRLKNTQSPAKCAAKWLGVGLGHGAFIPFTLCSFFRPHRHLHPDPLALTFPLQGLQVLSFSPSTFPSFHLPPPLPPSQVVYLWLVFFLFPRSALPHPTRSPFLSVQLRATSGRCRNGRVVEVSSGSRLTWISACWRTIRDFRSLSFP